MRPAVVDERLRYGDFEGDTVIGKHHKGALLTFVERKTKLTKMAGLPHRKASLIYEKSIELLKNLGVKTITFDNGKEFAEHEALANHLNADIYFAHPYRSWERGTNVNTNGLIRQFFTKKMKLDKLCPEKVQQIENLLNNRPRKVLGYLTPFEAMAKNHLVELHSRI